ncbi:MAG TPA: glutamate-1-semialdehyde 2,1-aminomutase [Spirochaetota bacterium]
MEKSKTVVNADDTGAKLTIEKSRQYFERAKKSLAGGVSSSARMPASGTLSTPLYITHGKNGRVWDMDGNEFVDFLLSYGSLILGHCNPVLIKAFEEQIKKGTMFGTCNTAEVELAEQICKMVPCADLVRYANSGSEAICGAIRAARGYTGKSKILKFEGHYHGWVDLLAISNRPGVEESGLLESPISQPHSKGIPSGVVEDVIICPWNNMTILKSILDKYDGQFAAIIAEPIVANNGCIMPESGYLSYLREECTRRGIILIFDEIVTGFRAAAGGAQEYFNIECDIAVFSKAIGGGMPISAFAGKREIMEPIAKNTVKHGGTYNGNPVSAVSALETLRYVSNKDVLSNLHASGDALIETIRREARDNNIPCVVQGLGSMFQVVFTERKKLTHYRDLYDADSKRYGIFRDTMLENGVHINSSFSACWFLSVAHTQDDIDLAKKSISVAMKKARG